MASGRFRSKFRIRSGMSPIHVPKTGKQNYFDRVMAIAGTGLIGYWIQNEGAGTTSIDYSGQANNGVYTGVTLGVGGIGDGRTATSFDGTTSFNNIYSAALNSDFNPSEGTLLAWAKVSGAGVWTDGIQRRIISIGADVNNRVSLLKGTANNTAQCVYAANSTFQTASIATSATGWIHLAITFSKSGDAVIAYLNGVKQGTTLTGLGVWAGALGSTSCCIGSRDTTPSLLWSGSIAHVALWATPLTAQQIATLYVV